MAATAWATKPPTEEVFFRNDNVSLCLLLNRRSRVMRVVDFRAGAVPSKRTFVLSVARRERIERIYGIVEREEMTTWQRAGLVREGTIPGFYRRSDGYVVGMVLNPEGQATKGRRGARGHLAMIPRKPSSDRTLRAGKRLVQAERGRRSGIRVVEMEESEVREVVSGALRDGTATTDFEPFGRGTERTHFQVKARGKCRVVVATEVQACFGNALIEVLSVPGDDQERGLCSTGVGDICDRLISDGICSIFGLSPTDDAGFAAVFLANGFRRTGTLSSHLLVGDSRRDAFLWCRKTET